MDSKSTLPEYFCGENITIQAHSHYNCFRKKKIIQPEKQKGTVTFAGETPGYGKTVVVTHRFGFQTRYAHLTLIYTRKGAKVEKGDVIGFVGSTGISTGNHLHYEVIKNQKRINPLNFIYGTK